MLGFTRRRGATLIYVFGGFVAPMLVPSLAAAQNSAPLRPVEADLQVRLNCDRVAATLKLPDATVTAARLVPAGSFTPPATGADTPRPVAGLPAFCRVELAITPSSDSDIRSEVWMPVSGWNGKFQQVGNGAFAGSIQYAALGEALRRGYAAASTDTGHTGPGAAWALGHPEKIADFGHRAVHETAVHSKSAISNFYGMAPKLSYFTGCSGGGRMAFQEAQRYPADFDAILAGAPAYDRGNEAFGFMAKWKATHETPQSVIPASTYPAIHRAALEACDALDGLKDGLIEDVLGCRFDPKVIECKAGANADSCLTTPQVKAVRTLYAGATNPKTGHAAVLRAGHGTLRRRRGPQRLRRADAARAVARAGQAALLDPGDALDRRQGRSQPSALPVSTDRALQGNGQHRPGRELLLRRARRVT